MTAWLEGLVVRFLRRRGWVVFKVTKQRERRLELQRSHVTLAPLLYDPNEESHAGKTE